MGKAPRMAKTPEIKWSNEPEEHDYPAALSYLCLLYDEQTATNHVDDLKRASISRVKAKDIFRASGLSLLGTSNTHVARDQQKIKSGDELSPLLLIRDSVNGKVIIADGYHRLCAVYSCDEDAVVPCKIA
jgi:disulfide oxidoreductase YuzD